MGALTCSSCAERDIQNAWNSVASLPEDIRMKGYLDALHMQGQGASVVRDNAASSTALGVEVGWLMEGWRGQARASLLMVQKELEK